MAIYHFTISNGSKSKGKVAATRAAYLTRSGAFANRDDLVFCESSNLPIWSESPEDFWSSADELERENARVYREAEFALPRELDRDAQVKLARDFARDFTAEHGLAYTLAIHDEDGHNPHAHMMWCDRQDDEPLQFRFHGSEDRSGRRTSPRTPRRLMRIPSSHRRRRLRCPARMAYLKKMK